MWGASQDNAWASASSSAAATTVVGATVSVSATTLNISASSQINLSGGWNAFASAQAFSNGVASATLNGGVSLNANTVNLDAGSSVYVMGGSQASSGGVIASGAGATATVDQRTVVSGGTVNITAPYVQIGGHSNYSPSEIGGGTATVDDVGLVTGGVVNIGASSSFYMSGGALGGGAMNVDAGSIGFTNSAAINVTALSLEATSSIYTSGSNAATINVGGGFFHAGGDIDLTGAALTIGNGTVAGVTGDTLVVQALQSVGIGPASADPNGTFIAGGTVMIGSLDFNGTYLWVQANDVATPTGAVSVNPATVVQFTPVSLTNTVGVEESTVGVGATNYVNVGLFSQLAGPTVVVGSSAQPFSGDVVIGTNGPVNFGALNFVCVTTGECTGLELVQSTGIVGTLDALIGSGLRLLVPQELESDPESGFEQGVDGFRDQSADEMFDSTDPATCMVSRDEREKDEAPEVCSDL
jgi:hypothetical protein